jgi:hypothetical protein
VNLHPITLRLVAVAAVSIPNTAHIVALLVITSQLTKDTSAPDTLIIAVIASNQTVNIRSSITTSAAVISKLAPIAVVKEILGLKDPFHSPLIVIPATFTTIPAAAVIVSVCHGATRIISPLFATHAAIAVVIVECLVTTPSYWF